MTIASGAALWRAAGIQCRGAPSISGFDGTRALVLGKTKRPAKKRGPPVFGSILRKGLCGAAADEERRGQSQQRQRGGLGDYRLKIHIIEERFGAPVGQS